jgi:hypothetical protein
MSGLLALARAAAMPASCSSRRRCDAWAIACPCKASIRAAALKLPRTDFAVIIVPVLIEEFDVTCPINITEEIVTFLIEELDIASPINFTPGVVSITVEDIDIAPSIDFTPGVVAFLVDDIDVAPSTDFTPAIVATLIEDLNLLRRRAKYKTETQQCYQ